MVMTDFWGKVMLGSTGVGSVLFGLSNGFNFNVVENFLPGYATLVYYAFLGIGVFALWGLFKR